MKLRRSLMVIAIALAASLPSTARADGCPDGCSNNEHVCAMQATIESMACVRGCGGGDLHCRLGCRRAMIANRKACRSQRMDCITSCSPAMLGPDAASTCAPSCGIGARTCAVDMATSAIACIHGCRRARPGGMADCLKQCAATLGSGGSSCVASFQGCLEGCGGQRPGACFDTVTEQCTAQACSAAQPCPAGQRCLASCPLPTPEPQCSGDPCGGRCFISPPCPAGVACPQVAQLGQCEITSSGDCGCVPYVPPTPQLQCSSDTCGGPCEIFPLCPPGGPCPERPPYLGQCEITSSGDCSCVPYVPPTPRPTSTGAPGTPSPTPLPVAHCGGDTCGGKCWVSPCPPGVPCPAVSAAQLGQCEITYSGDCECVPYLPPTPEPQCSGDSCGGPCEISPNALPTARARSSCSSGSARSPTRATADACPSCRRRLRHNAAATRAAVRAPFRPRALPVKCAP